jgi:hypothetical protein
VRGTPAAPGRGASSKRAKLYCSVLYAMLTRQLVTDWSGRWGVFYAMPTPALDPLFIAYNTGAGGRILHTICIVRKYFTQQPASNAILAVFL